MIGLLIAAYDLAEIVAKPISGGLADRYGMKKTMLAGIGFFIIASLLYLWIDPRLLLLVRFLQGMGAAALSAVSLALIGLYFQAERGRAYGIYNAIKGAGYVVSPALGGMIVLKSGFASIFLASAAIGLIAFFLSLMLPQTPRTGADLDDDDLSFKGIISILSDRVLLKWYVVIVVNMFFVGILFGFLPVRVYALGYGPVKTGLLLSIVAMSYLLIQPLAGWISDRVDTTRTIRIGLLFSGVCTIAVPLVSGVLLAIVSVAAGVGIGVVWTNTDHLISKLAREGQLGITMGAAGSFKEFGDMIGPILIGVLSQAFGLTAGFIVCGVLGLLSLALISRESNRVSRI